MRPTLVLSTTTSKSSSLQSPEGRLVEARLRISVCGANGAPSPPQPPASPPPQAGFFDLSQSGDRPE